MMIVSAKISKRKLFAGLAAAAGVIALLVFLSMKSGETSGPSAGTNEGRIAFLASYGWQADEDPTETQEVRIPEEFNEVFTRYNRLQQSQGYDLSAWAGNTVKRYVYTIRNYPGGGEATATLLVDGNTVIGGDVRSHTEGGTMHGFQRPTPTGAES